MTMPAMARPWPSRFGLFLILDSAIWPQTIPATPPIMKKPQQNPHKPRMLKMRERTASCSVFLAGTTVPGATTGAGAAMGEAGAGAALAGAAALTPGTVESAAHPAAPSYHA